MMSVDIKLELLATLKRYEPDTPDRFSIPAEISVRELIEILGIPEYEVNLVFLDGERGNLDSKLTGRERVCLFPPLGGG